MGKTAVGASDSLVVGQRFVWFWSALGYPLQPSKTANYKQNRERWLTLVDFYQDTVKEGSISVSGTTVSYNGGHLARWSRMLDGSKPENLLKGTVMTNLDEMVEWAYDETPEVLWAAGDGLPEGVSVGDVKVEGKEATYWGELGEAVPGFAGDVNLVMLKAKQSKKYYGPRLTDSPKASPSVM